VSVSPEARQAFLDVIARLAVDRALEDWRRRRAELLAEQERKPEPSQPDPAAPRRA
jgi:hypothetical protein